MSPKAIYLTIFALMTISVSAFDPNYYPNNQTLLPDYNLFWKVEGDTMRIAMKVKAIGWIGFGIGEQTSGSMPGADILVASIADGVTTLRDMYALKKDYPVSDDCQSWKLISGQETNGYTIVEAQRKLNTGDSQDRPFQAITRVIAAYGSSDTFAYHGSNRKPVTVQFWGSTAEMPTGTLTKEFLNTGYIIPTRRTTYEEKFFDVNITSDVSVVAIEHVVVTEYVHHFLVYGSTDDFVNASLYSAWDLVWTWAPGVDILVLPDRTGFTFGPSQYRSLRLQIHYDNPLVMENLTDASGIRIHFESTLRPIEAGVLYLGDASGAGPGKIPSGMGTIEFEYDCPSACTSAYGQELQVWANVLHMHQVGAQIWGKQWRDGQLVRETNRIDFWDFGLQQVTPVNYTLRPGDRISTHCVYNKQSKDVAFGPASDDEMCIQFIYYYPKTIPQMGFCAFYVDDSLPSNATFCNGNFLMNGEQLQTNPTQMDPKGGEVIAFGKPNPSSFVCQMITQTADESSSSILKLIISFILFLLL